MTRRAEGRKPGVILSVAPYNKKSPTSFWWGFFIVRCFGLIGSSPDSKKFSRDTTVIMY
jgi:hypothetical protein